MNTQVEVDVYENGMLVGTFDYPQAMLRLGYVLDQCMRIESVTPQPDSGSDYAITVSYVQLSQR